MEMRFLACKTHKHMHIIIIYTVSEQSFRLKHINTNE